MELFPASLQSHHTKLVEHERRLGRHEDELDEQREVITGIRLELAKMVAGAAIATAIFSAASTAAIVHYLSPGAQARVHAPDLADTTASRR